MVEHENRLVGVDLQRAREAVTDTAEHLRADMGELEWQRGMNPDIPATKVLDNPYTSTEYRTGATHQGPAA